MPTTLDLEANRDELVAARIVEAAKLGGKFGPEVYVYHHLIQALEEYGGYSEGDWDNPPEGGDRDTFYVFPYDWRRDNVESARLLVKRVEALKLKLGRPDLRFNVVPHSVGGLVARYAAMYGDRDLPPSGTEPRPDWAGAAFVNKIFMFGTPNEGSMEALSVLLEGYSVTEGLRRRVRLLNKLSREDVFTAPSIYQLLPHAGSARFLDQDLRPLSVDLYDPAVWRRYGWTAANDAAFRESFARGDARDEQSPRRRGTLEELDAYFAAVLERARRFHEALDVPAAARAGTDGAAPVRLFVCYAHEDERQLKRLDLILDILEQQHGLAPWRDVRLIAGEEWDEEIRQRLEATDIFLFVASQHSLVRPYIRDVELKRAGERHKAGEVEFVTVKLEPCAADEDGLLGKLQRLAAKYKSVAEASPRSLAWEEVRKDLLPVIRRVREKSKRGAKP